MIGNTDKIIARLLVEAANLLDTVAPIRECRVTVNISPQETPWKGKR
jgi:hypothetical protein